MSLETEEIINFDDGTYIDDLIPELKWNVVIADDDPAIHAVTKLVLSDVVFEGRSLNFISTYSGEETRKLVERTSEIAVILLDVVMETQSAGLEVVRFLRETLHNHSTRIILRTGQPGEAPERAVIAEFDINDYKEKADLTSQRLFSSVLTALRSYRDIVTIEKSKRGLEQILKSSNLFFSLERTLSNFANAVLDQMNALVQSDNSFMFVIHERYAGIQNGKIFTFQPKSLSMGTYLHESTGSMDRQRMYEIIQACLTDKKSLLLQHEYIGYFHSKDGFESVLYLRRTGRFNNQDKQLLNLLSQNITLAFGNLTAGRELIDDQQDVLHAIADLIESRNLESRGHTRRITEYAQLLSGMLDMHEDETDTLVGALAFHDIGMIAVPEHIMNKAGTLTPFEIETLHQHPGLGALILSKFPRPLMQAAAIIAGQHHERWDGTGYPAKLAAEAIHPYARIASIVDTFDSLTRNRPWRAALSPSGVREYLSSARGTHLEPRLCDLVLQRFESFETVLNARRD